MLKKINAVATGYLKGSLELAVFWHLRMVVDFLGGVFSTVKQIKGQRVFGLKSLNLDFRGFVSLTRIVGLQAKVVFKNSRRRKGRFANEN